MPSKKTEAVLRERVESVGTNFIREIIERDLARGAYEGRVVTRFPPEPNGYLHIGHAKSIVLNFGLAKEFDGTCHLRFDDTNPETEDVEYVESIKDSVRWLGYEWGDRLFYASDFFEEMYGYALKLIRQGKAYVDSLPEDEIREYRGSVTEPGRVSPFRDRPIEENLELFERMRNGEFKDGEHVLRAKGDLSSPNMKMRDPLLYRIRHFHHYRQGDSWCIYPMYDYAHPLEDAVEGVTHSLCTLEFENNREVYDWVLDNTVGESRPRQYEFARLTLDYTVMSKRKLLQLVKQGYVSGWDDPRMPTIVGLRRRGVTPEAIRAFCERIGVTRTESRVDMAVLEHSIRDDLNFRAPRVMCVLHPLKVIITNFPERDTEWLDADYWPHDVPKSGSRKVPFSRELFIERDDFQEAPPKGFFRLSPGQEVRLRYGYIIKCDRVIKNDAGEVVELHCTYDPQTKSGEGTAGRRVKGTIHWVSARHAISAEIRLYDRLFNVPDPEAGEEDFSEHLNSESKIIIPYARIEPSVAGDPSDTRYQFERQGYFWRDPVDSTPENPVFNRIVSLRDSWAKAAKGQRRDGAPVEQKVAEPRPSRAADTNPVDRLDAAEKARFSHYSDTVGLHQEEAIVLATTPELAAFFEEAMTHHHDPRGIASWVVNDVQRVAKDRSVDDLHFRPRDIARLAALMDDNTISSRIAKDVFAEMVEAGGDPDAIIDNKGLRQISDAEALEPVVDRTLAHHQAKVSEYRAGKVGLIGFFVGQVMRETGGKANPELVNQLLRTKLDS